MEGRARLYHWLRVNYDELAAAKSALNYTWKDLAETIGDAGATNAFGKRPDAEAVRKAWLKLEADKVKEAARSDPGQKRLNAPASHPQTSTVQPEQPGPQPASNTPVTNAPHQSRFQRRPVVMKGVPPTNPKENT